MIKTTDRKRVVLYALLWTLPLGYIFAESVHNTSFVTRDGVRRKAILMLRDKPRGNVVLCHSAAFDKESMLPYAKKLFADFNCLTFDFRRHGEETGRQYSTSGKKEIHEIEAAVKLIREHPKTKGLPVYGFGMSMGAAYLIESESKEKRFDGLILQSCFESLRKQIKRTYGFFRLPFMHNLIFREPILTIAQRRHNLKLRKLYPMHSIAKVETPIMLIHAKNDDYISFEAFDRLRQNSKSVIQTWTPDDGKHTLILETHPEEYLAQCEQFFAKLKKA